MKYSSLHFQNLIGWVIGLATLLLSPAPSAAQDDRLQQLPGLPQEVIKKLDLNGDGKINPGMEEEALRGLSRHLSDDQRNLLHTLEIFDSPHEGVNVADFDIAKTDIERKKRRCEPQQRLFVRDSVFDASLLFPALNKTGAKQATFSVSRNGNNDTWNWDVNGSAMVIAIYDKCISDEEEERAKEFRIDGYAAAPYVAFNGKGSSGSKGKSSLRFGLNNEWLLRDGLFPRQQLNLVPFYQTDFDFDAEMFGVQASWYPVNLQYHLGGLLKGRGPFDYWWTVEATAEYLRVNKPGLTNFAADTDYGWIGIELGAHVQFEFADGPVVFADTSYMLRQDVINNNNADLFQANLGMYLDPSKNTSLILTYQNGTLTNTLTEVDLFKLALGFKY